MPAYTQVLVSPGAIYLDDKNYTPQDDRRALFDIVGGGTPDINASSQDLLVIPGTNLTVSVYTGVAYVAGTSPITNDNGSYRVYSDSIRSITLGTANATNPRLDQIVLRVMDDEFDNSGFVETRIEVLPGTPTAGATLGNRNGAAALMSMAENSDALYLLADILVAAGATAVGSSNIKDRRIPIYRKIAELICGQTVAPTLDDILANLQLQTTVDLNLDYKRLKVLYSWDDVIASGNYWELMYVGGAAVWLMLGGADLIDQIATSQTTTSATYVDLTTAGPQITVPRAGTYDITYSATISSNTAGVVTIMSPKIGAAATADADGAENRSAQPVTVSRTIRKTLAAGDLIKLQYKSNGTAILTALNRTLRIRPVTIQ